MSGIKAKITEGRYLCELYCMEGRYLCDLYWMKGRYLSELYCMEGQYLCDLCCMDGLGTLHVVNRMEVPLRFRIYWGTVLLWLWLDGGMVPLSHQFHKIHVIDIKWINENENTPLFACSVWVPPVPYAFYPTNNLINPSALARWAWGIVTG